ncbi:hypothetical protein KEM52_004171, partial [Ascosphaera acerosa]
YDDCAGAIAGRVEAETDETARARARSVVRSTVVAVLFAAAGWRSGEDEAGACQASGSWYNAGDEAAEVEARCSPMAGKGDAEDVGSDVDGERGSV